MNRLKFTVITVVFGSLFLTNIAFGEVVISQSIYDGAYAGNGGNSRIIQSLGDGLTGSIQSISYAVSAPTGTPFPSYVDEFPVISWYPTSAYCGTDVDSCIGDTSINRIDRVYPTNTSCAVGIPDTITGLENRTIYFCTATYTDATFNLEYFYTVMFFENSYGTLLGSFADTFTNGHPVAYYGSIGSLGDVYMILNNDGDPVEVCTIDCFSNVLFLPGLEASRLYKVRNNFSEDRLWEPNWNSDVEDLYLNTNGESINLGIYTRDIINEGQGVVNIYKSFSDRMDDLVSGHKINAWEPYAYDWRQSVNEIVNNGTNYENGNVSLIDTLESLVDSSKSGKVTIVTHSNGGVLAKALLKKLQNDKDVGINDLIDKVDMLIMVAAPQIGTASALPAVMHGFSQEMLGGIFMDKTHARELGRNMPGAYGLLPSREYIDRVSASPVTFVDNAIPSLVTTNFINTFSSTIDSYSEYKDFLFGIEGRIDPLPNQTNLPISLSPNLFSKAENLHNDIDNWISPEGLRVIEIAGWGVDTISSFEYYPKLSCGHSLPCSFYLDERPRFTIDGDKTVVVPSAHYMSFSGNADRYWVNLEELKKYSHKNILEIDSLLDFISNSIQGSVPTELPHISKVLPIETNNRFRISIHSPVAIDAYNLSNKHTGKICSLNSDFCSLEEEIPNSSYLEFGEGKYLNIPDGEVIKIKLQGTDIGTFTYESEKVSPDGTSIVSSFVDIPVTPQTQGEVIMNQNNDEPKLKLDVTGDGLTDFVINPSDTFDPVLYLMIMKATINSLDISRAQKEAFSKRVDDILKLIQSNKLDKAKLKADKFKSALEKTVIKSDFKKPKPKKLSKTEAQLLLDMLNKLLDNIN